MKEKGTRRERRNKQAVGVAKRQGPDQRRKSSKRSGGRRDKAPTREGNQVSSRDSEEVRPRPGEEIKLAVGMGKENIPDWREEIST